jgi:hypothetical protein
MAYVFVLQVTLALSLNAWLPPSLSFAFGEICHAQIVNGVSDQQDDGQGSPSRAAAHCPLCLTTGLAVLAAPDAPAVILRSVLGIAFEVVASEPVRLADVHSPHLARGPPAKA